MKTSNKLLLILAMAAFFSSLSLMLYAKGQMRTKSEVREELKMTGNFKERVMLDDLTTENIEMGDNFSWIIDPTRTDVVVSGDEALVNLLTISDGKQFQIRTGGASQYNGEYDRITVVVGVKNLKKLRIDGNGNADVIATDPLRFDDLDLDMHGNSRAKMEITSPKIRVSCSGNARATLDGQTTTVDASISGNGRLFSEKLSAESAIVYASGNGRYFGGALKTINGSASGNAKIEVSDATEKSNVSTSGNARFTINR